MHYEIHPSFYPPEDKNAKIWRYINFDHFQNMLKEESLYFSKATKFLDPYEGTLPEYNNSVRQTMYSPEQFSSTEQYERFISNMPDVMKTVSKIEKENYIVNCWHLNEFESASMWHMYSNVKAGIAIQSTYEKIRKSFKNPNKIIGVGKVRYLDFKKEWGNEAFTLDTFLIKRKSFLCDNELRVISYLQDDERDKDGKHIKIDLNTLIERIYIAPLSEPSFEEKVKSEVEQTQSFLKDRINKSDLYSLV